VEGFTKVDEFHHQIHKYLKGPSPVILEVKAIRVPEQLPSLLKLKETEGQLLQIYRLNIF
jgi:hypothetical protein